MLREPFAYFRVLVSGVVVDDGIDPLSLGKMRVDVIEEADELLMPVALHVATDDGAVENVEGLRVLSRSKPSTSSAMNRACQVHTTGFALPDRRMISAVPQPSAVARRIWARHTCFCGAQRSETIASSRWRSARVTLTTIPALMTRA